MDKRGEKIIFARDYLVDCEINYTQVWNIWILYHIKFCHPPIDRDCYFISFPHLHHLKIEWKRLLCVCSSNEKIREVLFFLQTRFPFLAYCTFVTSAIDFYIILLIFRIVQPNILICLIIWYSLVCRIIEIPLNKRNRLPYQLFSLIINNYPLPSM